MAKKQKKPRNYKATEATLINVQATDKRLDALELKIHELANGQTSMEAAILSVKERLSHLEQAPSGAGVAELPADGDTD